MFVACICDFRFPEVSIRQIALWDLPFCSYLISVYEPLDDVMKQLIRCVGAELTFKVQFWDFTFSQWLPT